MWAQETQKILEAEDTQNINSAVSQEAAARNEIVKATEL